MTEPDRAERAFRDAITELDVPAAPDPAAARRQVRHRRLATLAVVATVLIVAVVGGFTWRGQTAPVSTEAQPESAQPSLAETSPPTDPAPSGWRTEYYRDISFSRCRRAGAMPSRPTRPGAPTIRAACSGPSSAPRTSGSTRTTRSG
jgi:hypothetical protein